MPNLEPAAPRRLFLIELLVLFLLLLGISWLSWQLLPSRFITSLRQQADQGDGSTDLPLSSPPTKPSSTPLPLPAGTQTYTFSHGKDAVGPKLKKLTIDPLTPTPGTTQSVTLTAAYPDPIDSVTIEVITDNKTEQHPLTLTSGDRYDGTWQGSWTVTDNYLYRYGLRLVLTSTSTYDDIMWFRNSL